MLNLEIHIKFNNGESQFVSSNTDDFTIQNLNVQTEIVCHAQQFSLIYL